SGEWGYSSVWSRYDEAQQAKCLPRQWLVNLANDVNLSIWYDWHDDGKDPKDGEHHFGTTLFPYYKDRETVYDPKPAYLAAKALTSTLKGFRFNKRLAVGSEQDWVLLFAKDGEVRLAAWSVAEKPQPLKIAASQGKFRAVNHLGQDAGVLEAGADGLTVTPADAPLYLIPDQPNDLLAVAAAWDRAALEYWLPARGSAVRVEPGAFTITLRLKNPLARELRIAPNAMTQGGALAPGALATWTAQLKLTRGDEPVAVRFECEVAGMGKLAQETVACVQAPLRLVLMPLRGDGLTLRIENPAGEAFKGTLALTDVDGLQVQEQQKPVELKDGEREKAVAFPCAAGEMTAYRVGARLLDEQGDAILSLPASRCVLLGGFPRGDQPLAYQVVPDGDGKVASEQALTVATPPEPPPLPGCSVLKLTYRFDPGWKFVRVVPTKEELKPLEGQPKALTLWVRGDGKDLSPRLRFVDATGQCFQPAAANVAFTDWRPVVFPLDGRDAGHWGGANDGKVHFPIKLDTLFLLDNGSKQKVKGALYLQAPFLSW
ncbi:MAG: hypothetical protein NTW87_31905, partial [Planctomycetota bacterium]|nr:hypothetical protein [Planctomycetota bacterium]